MRAVDGCGVAHPDGRERLICLTGCESKHRAGLCDMQEQKRKD